MTKTTRNDMALWQLGRHVDGRKRFASRDVDRHRRLTVCWLLIICPICWGSPSRPGVADEVPTNVIEVKDVFVRVREGAELPALERGQLRQISAEPGDSVSAGQVLAVLDDVDSVLKLELARNELQIAEREYKDSVGIAVASATLEEAKQLLSQARHDAEAAKSLATSGLAIEQAVKESDVARKEVDRAIAARREFSSSVSEQQLEKLILARDQNLFKLESARLEQAVAMIRSLSRESIVSQQQAATVRLEHALTKAKSDHEILGLNLLSLQKKVAIAAEQVERRKLKAPFAGMIVEQHRHAGEWVETGEPVLRLIQLDTLYVEGFADARFVTPKFRGHKVTVTCQDSSSHQKCEGQIVFVSPEIDPVTQQVQIRSEIRNPDMQLRPGQTVKMWIAP